ncbi:MAG: BlaI/MecI/CopY family transcriptional regulator [Thermoprotei archaeon]
MKAQRWIAPLEYDVLSAIWEKGELSVAEVRFILQEKGRPLALTTVSTVLDRLYKKGLVDRRIVQNKGNPRYFYIAKINKEEYERGLVSGLLDGLLEKMTEPTISRLMELMTENEEDKEILSKYLEKLKREKRK